MKNYLKKLLALIQLWIFGPPCTYTSPCCDKDREDKDCKDKKPEEPGKGGFAY